MIFNTNCYKVVIRAEISAWLCIGLVKTLEDHDLNQRMGVLTCSNIYWWILVFLKIYWSWIYGYTNHMVLFFPSICWLLDGVSVLIVVNDYGLPLKTSFNSCVESIIQVDSCKVVYDVILMSWGLLKATGPGPVRSLDEAKTFAFF